MPLRQHFAEPDRILDDLGREVMAAVAERSHSDILPDPPLAPDPVFVTMPFRQSWNRVLYDSPLEETVLSELVSKPQFPANRQKYREFPVLCSKRHHRHI